VSRQGLGGVGVVCVVGLVDGLGRGLAGLVVFEPRVAGRPVIVVGVDAGGGCAVDELSSAGVGVFAANALNGSAVGGSALAGSAVAWSAWESSAAA
jgi:hypothetical protein